MAGSLDELSARRFDILIVGGGIHGAFAAWDAASRGFDVALIDRGDFGGATSANSLKIVHGGFRYLQSMNVRRLRHSNSERGFLLGLAPHLVRPLACVAPLSGGPLRSRAAAAFALRLNGALTRDRNHGLPASHHIPRGRVLDRAEYRDFARQFAFPDARGGVLWYDAQLVSPDRLLISVVRSAAREGACVRNYVTATTLLREDDRVLGALVSQDDEIAEVRAHIVVLAANEGVADLLQGINLQNTRARDFAKACNAVLAAPGTGPDVAVAMPAWNGKRFLFAVPWGNCLLLGTSQHAATVSNKDALRELLATARSAAPQASVGLQNVRMLHCGLLPGNSERLRDYPDVRDHESRDGVAGLVSLLGTKWTTARRTASLAIDLCARRLGRARRTNLLSARLVGSGYVTLEDLTSNSGSFPVGSADRLNTLYGSASRELLALAQQCPRLTERIGTSSTIAAQIAHAVRYEYARHLDDIVLRRTELGSEGQPSEANLRAAADVAAGELGWTVETTEIEMDRVRSRYVV